MTTLAVEGYRSLRNVRVSLEHSLITGRNGNGKSSLYRALRLLADIAQGHIEALWSGRTARHKR